MKREQIDQRYKWRLEDIIPSDEVWEEEFAKLAKYGDELAALDVGIVKSMPIAAATNIPLKKGVIAVAAAMPLPSMSMSQMNG